VGNYPIYRAKAIAQWLAAHPRLPLLSLPTYCPRANPIERVFGDVYDCCTGNHRRKRLRDLMADIKAHLHVSGPWPYKLSEIYYGPAVPAAVEKSPQGNMQRLPHECTKLIGPDLNSDAGSPWLIEADVHGQWHKYSFVISIICMMCKTATDRFQNVICPERISLEYVRRYG
jgi:hypothetical protein